MILQTILLLDVDFIVTERLHERLAGSTAAGALAEDLGRRRTAVVLPAFETSPQLSLPEGHSVALQAVSRETASASASASAAPVWSGCARGHAAIRFFLVSYTSLQASAQT